VLFQDPFHKLLDIALRVPTHLQSYDTNPEQSSEAKLGQLNQMREILPQLDDWKNAQVQSPPNSSETTEPRYCIDLGDKRINLHDDLTATYFTFYAGVRVVLCSLAQQLAQDLLKSDSSAETLVQQTVEHVYKWSKIIRKCLEYFQRNGRFPLGKVTCLFAFDAAWATFLELRDKYDVGTPEELEWCHNTSEWM
jgi:hypothetical protein